jgi:hypothetical protein
VRRVQTLEERSLALRPPAAAPVPLEQPEDVLAVLAEQVNAVRAGAASEPNERARTLGFLAGLALRAMEGRDLAARLEAVERVLKLRKEAERQQQQQQGAKRRAGYGC